MEPQISGDRTAIFIFHLIKPWPSSVGSEGRALRKGRQISVVPVGVVPVLSPREEQAAQQASIPSGNCDHQGYVLAFWNVERLGREETGQSLVQGPQQCTLPLPVSLTGAQGGHRHKGGSLDHLSSTGTETKAPLLRA